MFFRNKLLLVDVYEVFSVSDTLKNSVPNTAGGSEEC